MSNSSSEKHKLCMIDCKSLQLSERTKNLKTITLNFNGILQGYILQIIKFFLPFER